MKDRVLWQSDVTNLISVYLAAEFDPDDPYDRGFTAALTALREEIEEDLPAAPESAQRALAEWQIADDNGSAKCSFCSDTVYYLYRFCPNCGSKMRNPTIIREISQ